MPKTGEFKTGEGPTGDIAQLVLAAASQAWAFDTPTQGISGSGSADLNADTQVWGFEANPEISPIPSKTGQSKTGEFPTGGLEDPNLQLLNIVTFDAPTQSWSFDTPTQSITGSGNVNISPKPQTWAFDTPTANIGYGTWVLGGQPIGSNLDERVTHQLLEITQRVQTSTLTGTLRALKSDQGQVDILATDDGGFVAVDRAGGGNTFELIPPIYRQPLRQTGDYHVSRYEESLVSQDVSECDVEVEFIPDANRSDSAPVNETPGANDWALSTPNGQIATESVDAEFLGTGSDGVERFELAMRLTFEQAHAWETEFDRIEGVRVRVIPDSTNIAVDDTSGDVNTLNVTAPTTGTEVPSGDYVVMSWESERLNDAFQEVSAEIADAG